MPSEVEILRVTVAELERKLITTRASYMHQMDDLRGAVGGRDEKLLRWMRTCQDAVTMNPPRVEVIEERLENAIDLLTKKLT